MSNKNKLGQEPAFPSGEIDMETFEPTKDHLGMSKRFYAACKAMQGLCSSEQIGITAEQATKRVPRVVKLAYVYADELLKQEEDESI